jgi:hypothetical protein
MLTDITLGVDLAAVCTRTFSSFSIGNLMTRQSRAISYAVRTVLYMNLHESKHNSQRAKLQQMSIDYTIDIVIALLNTVCFVNISIPKAKAKHICEEFKFAGS